MIMARTVTPLVTLAILSGLAAPAAAGVLDYIRDYDLNDYALGVAVTTTQTPYGGGGSSVLPYPYLTSFRPSVFTRDWLLLFEDVGTGVRYVSEGGFEVGAVGNFNSGGFGREVSPELLGLKAREWTIEGGGYVGWRGRTMQAQLRAYTDLLGRNGGSLGELSVSLPFEFAGGYLIPMAEAIYADATYNRYYYGVDQAESGPARPVYVPDGDMNYRLRLRFGWRLSDKWLLSGYVAAESLGDEVRQSPIVNKDRIYSYNLGLAYNADVFLPRDYAHADKTDTPVELRVGAFFVNIDTEFQFPQEDRIPGDIFDLESDGSGEDSKWAPQLDLLVRLADYHRIELGYFEVGRRSSTVAIVPRQFGEIDLPLDEPFRLSSRYRVLRATYSYSLIRDAQKELALTGGVHRTTVEIDIENADGERELVEGNPVSPVIGAEGSVALGDRSRLAARLQLMRSAFGSFDGYVAYGSLDFSRQLTRTVQIGLAINAYLMRLESTRQNFEGTFQALHWGPALFVTLGF